MLDYTGLLGKIIAHIVSRVPEFAHVDPSRILVAFAQTRRTGGHGTRARLVPLRFQGGARTKRSRGRTWRMPTIEVNGREMLYVVFFFLPRFCDLSLEDKLTTIFHELYHISPDFDGDVRRFPGRNWQHGSSREAYDARLRKCVTAYLAGGVPDEWLEPLRLRFAALRQRYGAITGTRLRQPRPMLDRGARKC